MDQKLEGIFFSGNDVDEMRLRNILANQSHVKRGPERKIRALPGALRVRVGPGPLGGWLKERWNRKEGVV